MSARKEVLTKLGEIHSNKELYDLVVADTPGANELWQNIGVLHMRLMAASPPTAQQTRERIRRLKERCTGALSKFDPDFEAAISATSNGDW